MIDSARIRRELEALLADQTKAVRDLAQTVADRASAAIAAGQPPSEVIARAVEGYDQALQDRISRDVTKAVCMGAGIWPEVATTGFVDQFAAQALVMSWDASQMPLSTRIHGTSVAMRAELDSAIRASISRRDGAWKQARRIYDGYGFGGIIHQDQLPGLPKDLDALVQASRATLTPEGLADLQARAKALKKYAASLRTAPLRAAYTQLLGNLEKGLARGLERAIKTAAEEKARYHAERISRTETARAWGQGFMDQLDRDEDATGLRWETSSAHKIFDICDFHARADLYGMGPGIYPKERRPRFPAHPHCLCVLSAVYKGKPRFDQVDKGGKAALDGMTPGQRARVLTIKGAEGFDRGGSWKGSLRQWEEPRPYQMSMGSRETLRQAQRALDPYADRIEAAALAQGWKIWSPGDPTPPPFEGRTDEGTAWARELQRLGEAQGTPIHHHLIQRIRVRKDRHDADLSDERILKVARTGEPWVNAHGQLVRMLDGVYVPFDKETGWAINVMVRRNSKEAETWTPLP